MSNSVFIVSFTTGEYDSVTTSIDGVYSSKEDALSYVNKVLDICEHSHKVHRDYNRDVFIINTPYAKENDLNELLEKMTNAYVYDGIIAFEIKEHKVL